jgi:seryl-tRNA synthetase
MKTNLEMQAQISKLNQLVDTRDNLEAQLEEKERFIQEQMRQKSEMHKDLDRASDQLLEQEDKIMQANKTALELLNQLKEADIEIEGMKARLKQLQAMSAVYVPVKGDEIDMALADYLNYNAKTLEVMFIRLQPGIYSFGSKKVCVKVENQRINIRIGGGYMAIEEFLEKFTVVELDRTNAREEKRASSPMKK